MAKYRKAWLHSPVLPIQHRVLVYADSPGEIPLPPPPVAAVLPEPVGEGMGGVAGDREGELDRTGVFGFFIKLDCTGTHALRD